MRCILACWCVLLCGGTVPAAPRSPDTRPQGPPLSHDEAQNFALQLKTTLDLVARQYARPVERADLVVAALRGMYQAVGTPAPRHLADDVKKADPADNKLVELITLTRERLGSAPALAGTKDLEVSLWAVLRALDPYCFLTINEAYDVRNLSAAVDGVGVELEPGTVIGPLRVKAVVPGSPAQRAGVRPGDLITHLAGQSLEGKPAAESEAAWRKLTQAEIGQPFGLRVLRPGQKTARTITLEPGTYQAETVFGVDRRKDNGWNYYLDGKHKIAHIRLGALKGGTSGELERVLLELQKDRVRGLILDLRWCPGGLLDEAVDVASLFVGNRTIATIEYRGGRKQTCTRRQFGLNGPEATPTFPDVPLVVLVNEETRGGGELVAAAVQDCKRGLVVGQRTVGKGSVQNSLMADQGTMAYNPGGTITVRLSIGVFTRISGKNLQRFATSKPSDDWGVRPDAGLEFAVSRELSRKLKELWELQNLRPGTSDEALPMDDPANDAPREFALKALRKAMGTKAAAK